jgi:hypothetical protein
MLSSKFHIIFFVHSDVKSQIKKPTSALYFTCIVQCPYIRFGFTKPPSGGAKVYIYLTSIIFVDNLNIFKVRVVTRY